MIYRLDPVEHAFQVAWEDYCRKHRLDVSHFFIRDFERPIFEPIRIKQIDLWKLALREGREVECRRKRFH